MDASLSRQIHAELGARVASARALTGGSINAAWALSLSDGRRVFLKQNTSAPAAMFELEARGLELLRGPDTGLRVPKVLHVAPTWLLLELLESGPRRPDFEASLGRGLAALHRAGAAGPSRFGLDHDNYIGSEAQPNAWTDDWPSFYREQRLEPMLARARERGLVQAPLDRAFEGLYVRLEALCGPPEPPARLHGDLWGGNLHVDADGGPALIDPAVYFGHREVDLAMMRLFGGFGPRVFAAYEEAWPLAPGWERRVLLYQLYPLLVHLVLFGAGYLGQVHDALARLS